jgi:DNA-binding NarL/FixJ family response regulator
MVRSSAKDTIRRITVLCVACSPQALERLKRLLQHSRIHILSAASREQAVALCVSHAVSIAVIDGESLRGQELPLAEALKIIRPSLRVVLLEERQERRDLPPNVDSVVPAGAPEYLLGEIEELLNKSGDVGSSV